MNTRPPAVAGASRELQGRFERNILGVKLSVPGVWATLETPAPAPVQGKG